jgi:hypothetical protein
MRRSTLLCFAVAIVAVPSSLLGGCGSFGSEDAKSTVDAGPTTGDGSMTTTADGGVTDTGADTNVTMTDAGADGRVASSLPECAAQRVVHLVGGNGGVAHFTQTWPVPSVITGYQATYAYDDPKTALYAPGATPDHPLYARAVAGKALWSATGTAPQPTVFVAGLNETHTTVPAQTVIGTTDVVASGALAQKPLAPPVGVLEFEIAGIYGAATGAPTATHVTTISDAINAIGLATTLTAAQRSALYPDPATVNTWLGGPDGGAASTITTIAETLLFAVNVFKAGYVGTIVAPAYNDDPHGYFAAGPGPAGAASDQLAGVLQQFYAALATTPEPSCSHNGAVVSLADNVAFIATGDTPRDPFVAAGWPDGTPGNSNWIFFRSNGWLKPGWFGGIDSVAGRQLFDPTTGTLNAGATTTADDTASRLAILFAITRGNTQAVTAVSNAAYQGAVSTTPP